MLMLYVSGFNKIDQKKHSLLAEGLFVMYTIVLGLLLCVHFKICEC